MSKSGTSISPSSSDDDLLHRSGGRLDDDEMYERVGVDHEVEEVGTEFEELDLDGNPVYHDEDDKFDYPDTDKQFGEVVVIMKHIQKCTMRNTFAQEQALILVHKRGLDSFIA
jgi:hypothetical protein